MIRPKLCGNCAFSQNVYTRKLGEITVFYTVFLVGYATVRMENIITLNIFINCLG